MIELAFSSSHRAHVVHGMIVERQDGISFLKASSEGRQGHFPSDGFTIRSGRHANDVSADLDVIDGIDMHSSHNTRSSPKESHPTPVSSAGSSGGRFQINIGKAVGNPTNRLKGPIPKGSNDLSYKFRGRK